MRGKSWPIVKPRTNASGSVSWMVDCGLVSDKRLRYFFKTKAEADQRASEVRVARRNQGTAAFAIPEHLRIEALQAADLLEPFGVSLLEAVKSALPLLRIKVKSLSLAEMIREFLDAKRSDGASQRYMQDLRNKLDTFASTFGDRLVTSFSGAEIDDWLRGLKSERGSIVSAVTRNNFRRVLSVLFNFGRFRKYLLENPIEGTSRAKEIDGPIGILKVSELKALLNCCPPALLPSVAIAAFAGLRRSELERLQWEQVDLESQIIEVPAVKAKSARRRLVKIRPNLLAWLQTYRGASGSIVPKGFREMLERARSQAGLHSWPHNALRHSFASYALSQEGDAAALALDLGHTNTAILFRHYREVVKPSEAKQYWNIVP